MADELPQAETSALDSSSVRALIAKGWPPLLAKATVVESEYVAGIRGERDLLFKRAFPSGGDWVEFDDIGSPWEGPVYYRFTDVVWVLETLRLVSHRVAS